MGKRDRWLIFWGSIALAVFLLVNGLLYFCGVGGMFYSMAQPSDFLYTYEAAGELSFEQFIRLNVYLEDVGRDPISVTRISETGIELTESLCVPGSKALREPEEYNLTLVDTNTTTAVSTWLGLCVVGTVSVSIAFLICVAPAALFPWARGRQW